MKKRKGLIIALIILIILGLLMNCSDDEKSSENSTTDETTAEETINDKEVLFEKDELINDFFVKYQELSNTEFKDFSSQRTYWCSAENSGYWFDVSNYSDTTGVLEVRINETNETADAGVPAMREVYYYTVKTLDNTLSDEDIYRIFDGRINDEDEYKGEQTLSSLKILITPDMELSGGHNRGHIDIEKTISE